MAAAGPIPMIAGSTPTAAKDLKIPRIGRPLLLASPLDMRRAAEAPSVTWEALGGGQVS